MSGYDWKQGSDQFAHGVFSEELTTALEEFLRGYVRTLSDVRLQLARGSKSELEDIVQITLRKVLERKPCNPRANPDLQTLLVCYQYKWNQQTCNSPAGPRFRMYEWNLADEEPAHHGAVDKVKTAHRPAQIHTWSRWLAYYTYLEYFKPQCLPEVSFEEWMETVDANLTPEERAEDEVDILIEKAIEEKYLPAVRRRFAMCCSKLSADQHNAIVLRYGRLLAADRYDFLWEQQEEKSSWLSYCLGWESVAEKMGIETGTARQLGHRGLASLKKMWPDSVRDIQDIWRKLTNSEDSHD